MAGCGSFPRTSPPSHQVKLLVALLLVMFLRKFFVWLLMMFRSTPPCLSQLLLAFLQVFNSPTKSKHTLLLRKSHRTRKLLLWQACDFSSVQSIPTEMPKKTVVCGNMSVVNRMCRAKTHSAAGTVAASATEQNDPTPISMKRKEDSPLFF